MAQKTSSELTFPAAVDTSIKAAAIILLVGWSFLIVAPFLVPIVWGAILAVACAPFYSMLAYRLGDRPKIAAVLVSLILILAILFPCWLLADSLIAGAQMLKDLLEKGELRIPPPSEQVRGWPLVGETIFSFWNEAAINLDKVFKTIAPQLRSTALTVVGAATSIGVTVLQFLFSSVLAGIFLAYGEGLKNTAEAASRRIDKTIGQQFLLDAVTTIRNVARGILGVAFIQAVLAGIGLAAVGIPGAGLWAMVCLIFGIVQLGAGIVMVPAAIYVFSAKSLGVAIGFLIWAVLVVLSDNVLKPILLGKGAPVPMLVVFLGSIGGLINHGLIGLFVGAIVLSLGYKLVVIWIRARPKTA